MFIVNGKYHCCNDILLTSGFHRFSQRTFKKNTNYFMLLQSAFR